MNRRLLFQMRCPYTGSPLTLVKTGAEAAGRIEFGIVESAAGRFPIIAGVLRLLTDELRAPLLQLVDSGAHDLALRGALEVPAMTGLSGGWDRLWRLVAQRLPLDAATRSAPPAKRHLHSRLTRQGLTFEQLAAGVDAPLWAGWQTYRFSMPTFQPVFALAHLAAGARRILDFGCGLGHSAFLMQRLAPQADIVCADYSFTSMYLARRYLVPAADCLCLDGDFPLPFDREYFDCVFSTDAIQYIEAKIGLAREFRRIMTADGVVVLAHLHNRRSPRTAGTALDASGYDGLFDGMQRRMYPEEGIVADYVARGALDLAREYRLPELDAALGGLSLVAANSSAPFVERRGLVDAGVAAMRGAVVNPLYEVTRIGDRSVLTRKVGAPFAFERDIEGCEILPQRFETPLALANRTALDSAQLAQRAELRELARRFLLIDVPAAYC